MKKNYVTMMRELREDHDLRQKEVAAYLKLTREFIRAMRQEGTHCP